MVPASLDQVGDLVDLNCLENLDALADDSNRVVDLSVAFHPAVLETKIKQTTHYLFGMKEELLSIIATIDGNVISCMKKENRIE